MLRLETLGRRGMGSVDVVQDVEQFGYPGIHGSIGFVRSVTIVNELVFGLMEVRENFVTFVVDFRVDMLQDIGSGISKIDVMLESSHVALAIRTVAKEVAGLATAIADLRTTKGGGG